MWVFFTLDFEIDEKINKGRKILIHKPIVDNLVPTFL